MRSGWLEDATQTDPVDRPGHARDGLEFRLEAGEQAPAHGFKIAGTDGKVEIVGEDLRNRRRRPPEKAQIGVVLAERSAGFGDHDAQLVDRDGFAVDQHAVTIEDHELRGGCHRTLSVSGSSRDGDRESVLPERELPVPR